VLACCGGSVFSVHYGALTIAFAACPALQPGIKVWIPNPYDEDAQSPKYRSLWLPAKVGEGCFDSPAYASVFLVATCE
jgi:hypothetical protein